MPFHQTNRIKRDNRPGQSSIPPNPFLAPNVTRGGIQNQRNRNQQTSAFRAVSNMGLPVAANAASQVLYPIEQFDLANEYNPSNSTFTPRNGGVYSIQASYEFQPAAAGIFTLEIVFLINGEVFSRNNENFTGNQTGTIANSDLVQLNAGDEVLVAMRSTSSGTVLASEGTHFSAAGLPSSRT